MMVTSREKGDIKILQILYRYGTFEMVQHTWLISKAQGEGEKQIPAVLPLIPFLLVSCSPSVYIIMGEECCSTHTAVHIPQLLFQRV